MTEPRYECPNCGEMATDKHGCVTPSPSDPIERFAAFLQDVYEAGVMEGKARQRLGGGPGTEQACAPDWTMQARQALRELGAIFPDPALIAAVREARERQGCECRCGGCELCDACNAMLDIGRAVMEQVKR